jgi:hypothetical protein
MKKDTNKFAKELYGGDKIVIHGWKNGKPSWVVMKVWQRGELRIVNDRIHGAQFNLLNENYYTTTVSRHHLTTTQKLDKLVKGLQSEAGNPYAKRLLDSIGA